MSLKFLNLLSQIDDPRRAQGKKWQLGPVLLATILAILSGATSYRKVHRFIEAHRERLNQAFGFGWKSVPAYSAMRTIVRGLDPCEVERVFRACWQSMLSLWSAGPRRKACLVSKREKPVK